MASVVPQHMHGHSADWCRKISDALTVDAIAIGGSPPALAVERVYDSRWR